jgi:hypothetical protein
MLLGGAVISAFHICGLCLLTASVLPPNHEYWRNQQGSENRKLDDRAVEPQGKASPSKTLHHHWEIETKYDQFKDATVVSIADMELPDATTSSGLTHPLLMSASYFCLGKTVSCWPVGIILVFQANTKDWLYQTVHRTLIFLVDGKRVLAPSADWDGSVIGAGSLLEQMTTIIPTGQFLRIIHGHDVKGQIAFTTFDFTDENLEALQDLLGRIRPAGPKANSATPPKH